MKTTMKTDMKMLTMITACALACSALSPIAAAQDGTSLGDVVENLELREGLIPLYIDTSDGRILARLDAGEGDDLGRMIYTARMTSGLGSNPIGIDRGLGSSSEILRFFRVNDQVFAEFENTG